MGQLRRDLGLREAVGVGLGAIVGAGIFVVTGVAAQVAGPSFLVGLAIAGVAATANALSSAQLAAAYPYSGGTYEYGYRVLNPWLGFGAGWMFLISKLAAGGTVALGFAGYVCDLFPGLPEKPLAVGAVIFLVALNYRGIKKTGKLNTVIVACTLASLSYFVVSGIPALDVGHFHPFAPNGIEGVLESGALLFFAYTGYARLATLGEEVYDPKVTIPKAIRWTIFIALFLYAAVAFVAVGLVGASQLGSTTSPLVLAASSGVLPGSQTVVSIGAVTAMLGVLLSQILGISRMSYAMAKRGDLPIFLSHTHPTYQVPDRGILLAGLILVTISLLGTLEEVASASSFTILLYYTVTNMAALRMPKREKLVADWIPSLGLISCFVLAMSLKASTIFSGLLLLSLGVAGRLVLHSKTT